MSEATSSEACARGCARSAASPPPQKLRGVASKRPSMPTSEMSTPRASAKARCPFAKRASASEEKPMERREIGGRQRDHTRAA